MERAAILPGVFADLPTTARPQKFSDEDGTLEHRWLSDDGLYVVATMWPPAELETAQSTATRQFLSIVARYQGQFEGSQKFDGQYEMSGGETVLVARLGITSDVGEALDLLVATTYTPEGRVVSLQVVWPSAADELLAPQGVAVLESLELN